MSRLSIAQTKARLSEVVSRVERGEEIVVTRRGRPVARLVAIAAPRKPLDMARLDAFREAQPSASVSSVETVRHMRDESY
jgi:prevent-host-death family protein